MDVRVGLERKLSARELMLLNCGVGEDSWESLGLQGDQISQSWRKSVLNIHWTDCCWSWNCNTLATWCEELTYLKRPWCWEWLKVGEERDDRGWVGWMASPTQWTLVWVNSGSWWWTGKPGVLQSMGSQRVGHDWVTGLNWRTSNHRVPIGLASPSLQRVLCRVILRIFLFLLRIFFSASPFFLTSVLQSFWNYRGSYGLISVFRCRYYFQATYSLRISN